jgi:hypothetical protein
MCKERNESCSLIAVVKGMITAEAIDQGSPALSTSRYLSLLPRPTCWPATADSSKCRRVRTDGPIGSRDLANSLTRQSWMSNTSAAMGDSTFPQAVPRRSVPHCTGPRAYSLRSGTASPVRSRRFRRDLPVATGRPLRCFTGAYQARPFLSSGHPGRQAAPGRAPALPASPLYALHVASGARHTMRPQGKHAMAPLPVTLQDAIERGDPTEANFGS